MELELSIELPTHLLWIGGGLLYFLVGILFLRFFFYLIDNYPPNNDFGDKMLLGIILLFWPAVLPLLILGGLGCLTTRRN